MIEKPSPVPFSYSKVKAFEQCGFQYHKEKVLRLYPKEDTEAMRYGIDFHQACEDYIKEDVPFPKKYNFFKPTLDALAAIKGIKFCEYKMGVKDDLNACGFKNPDVYWRGISDLSIINNELAWAFDYKTGSKKSLAYADTGQIELMALGTFAHFPVVQKVKGALIYSVANKIIKETYTREDIPKLWMKWLNKFETMQAAYDNDVWNQNQSGLCYKHCQVLSCPHNGRG